MRILKTITKLFAALCAAILMPMSANAQGSLMKLNPYARMAVIEQGVNKAMTQNAATKNKKGVLSVRRSAETAAPQSSPAVTVMLKSADGADARNLIQDCGGRTLLSRGNIHIATLPMASVMQLADNDDIVRIEMSPLPKACTDTTALLTNALPAYQGENIDHGYNGEGVIVGVADIGFDLTHPNFYKADMSEYRIKRLWDILSTDTLGQREELFTGHEYTTEDDILALKHSYDGEQETHGTHTAGTAAGGGYDTPYRGIAWGSDICLVSTVASDNYDMIDSLRRKLLDNSYLGSIAFDYIFNYAQEQGKPCVINYSIGSPDDYDESTYLQKELLDSLTGPGRIIVSSAGNKGHLKNYFHKQKGTASMGCAIRNSDSKGYLAVLKTDTTAFDIRLVTYGDTYDTLTVKAADVPMYEETDSFLVVGDSLSGKPYIAVFYAYHSAINHDDLSYEIALYAIDSTATNFGVTTPMTIEIVGEEADVEYHNYSGTMTTTAYAPHLNAGDNTHGVTIPAAAESVIAVGGTAYRDSVRTIDGGMLCVGWGKNGERAVTSSIGPALSGRIKPDVMAPGLNVISSYSSYFYDNYPKKVEENSVKVSTVNGRKYPWTCDSGTSMAAPVVAGAIALWLQACPTLTPQDVFEIIAETSTHPDETLEYPNNYYGYGQINVYEGLLKAIEKQAAGITETEAEGNASTSDDWYDLRGIKLNGKPTGKGIYINRGKLKLTIDN